jgi:hypothetical protein
MKTDNISQGSNLLRQAKLLREEKAPNQKEHARPPVEEKVDLSTRTSSGLPHVPPTYEEVLDLLYGTDFSQLKDIEWISQEGRSSLLALL